jgi:hypothetical protein
MKKHLIIMILLILPITISKSYGQIDYGGGLFFATQLNNPGIDLRTEFYLMEDLVISPKLDLTWPDIKWGPTFVNEFCLHAHYLFYQEDLITAYPLAGINIQNYIDFDKNPFDIDFSFGMGFCAGVGAQLHVSESMSFFAEARYATGRYHQLMLTGGIVIHGDKGKED